MELHEIITELEVISNHNSVVISQARLLVRQASWLAKDAEQPSIKVLELVRVLEALSRKLKEFKAD